MGFFCTTMAPVVVGERVSIDPWLLRPVHTVVDACYFDLRPFGGCNDLTNIFSVDKNADSPSFATVHRTVYHLPNLRLQRNYRAPKEDLHLHLLGLDALVRPLRKDPDPHDRVVQESFREDPASPSMGDTTEADNDGLMYPAIAPSMRAPPALSPSTIAPTPRRSIALILKFNPGRNAVLFPGEIVRPQRFSPPGDAADILHEPAIFGEGGAAGGNDRWEDRRGVECWEDRRGVESCSRSFSGFQLT